MGGDDRFDASYFENPYFEKSYDNMYENYCVDDEEKLSGFFCGDSSDDEIENKDETKAFDEKIEYFSTFTDEYINQRYGGAAYCNFTRFKEYEAAANTVEDIRHEAVRVELIRLESTSLVTITRFIYRQPSTRL